MTSTPPSPKDLVLGALNAALTGDVESFLDVLHPAVRIHEPAYLPYGGVYEGREGFLQLLGEAAKVLDLSGLELVSATGDSERTVLLMTIPLVGHDRRVHITEHWCVTDGLVTDVRVFWFDHPDRPDQSA